MKIRIYYEDTDAGGIVYHTNYIKYCERARSELFFQNNMSPTLGKNSGFVVKNIHADFKATSKLGDMLTVTTKLLSIKATSLTLLQEVWNNEVILFSMEVVMVYVEGGKPRRIPEIFKEMFKKFDD